MTTTIDIDRVDPAEIDLNNFDLLAQRVPHDWFAWLRRNAPVFRHRGPDEFWVVTRWADVVEVGKHPEIYANTPSQIGLGERDEFAGPGAALGSELRHLLMMDPPEHTHYRKLLNKRFTPRKVREHDDHIRFLARRRIRDVVQRGECDLVVDLATPLPLELICEMLGVPEQDQQDVCRWSNELIGSTDPEYRIAPDTLMNAVRSFFGYIDGMAEARKACRARTSSRRWSRRASRVSASVPT